MLSLVLCIAAFAMTALAARRSLVTGLMVASAIGYVYGIVRANVPQTMSHFVFDASIAALYLLHLSSVWRAHGQPALAFLRPWFLFLVGWPILLTLIPVQDYWVQLVGLRGSIYFLPMLLFGAVLSSEGFRRLALFLAVLNLAAFGVAAVQFFVGIEPFFPRNAVTEIMYRSRDVGGGNYRIPATFSSAHAYAGTMVATIPLIFGTLNDPGRHGRWRWLLIAALVASGVGVFMAAARQPVIILGVVLLAGILRSRTPLQTRLGAVAFIAILLLISMRDERLQRFQTLQDTEAVEARVQGSVNASFFEYMRRHPLGNGIGGGGTSMPYFLANRLRDPQVLENEYGRILLEQGVAGLVGWLCFLAVLLAQCARKRAAGELSVGRSMAFVFVLLSCISGAIGLGMFTSIPQTIIFLLLGGWMIRHPATRRQPVPDGDVALAGAPRFA